MNVKTATLEETIVTIELGIGIEAIGLIGLKEEIEEIEVTGVIEGIEEIEETEGCPDGMLGVMRTIDHHGETKIFSKAEAIVAEAVVEAEGVIATNLPCKWEGEIGKKVPAHHLRRRNPPPISPILYR